jgi:uncharacterized membrane-anchored protein
MVRAGAGLRVAVLLLILTLAGAARADQAPDAASREQEAKAAWQAAGAVAVKGQATVDLRDQGKFALPDQVAWIPNPEATRLMRAMGNVVGSSFIGLAVAEKPDEHWFATVSFIGEGYIKDDDARNWKVDELLDSVKKDTEAANDDRRDRGFTALVIDGWIEKPSYDQTRHTLVWSVGAHDEGDADHAGQGVNYNTYLLGRDGYFSLDFVTDAAAIAAQKPIATSLLDGLGFVAGKRYTDYTAGTDRVAEYGLAALVGGVVAKKLGLLAIVAAFAVKFAKIGLIAAAGGLVAARKFLARLFNRTTS